MPSRRVSVGWQAKSPQIICSTTASSAFSSFLEAVAILGSTHVLCRRRRNPRAHPPAAEVAGGRVGHSPYHSAVGR